MTIRKLPRSVFVAFVVFLGLSVARAQSGLADIQGVVTDVQGGVLVGAGVVLTNTASGAKRTVKTGIDGRYSFPTVAPGHYSLTGTASGFSSKTITDLTIQLDNHLNQVIELAVGSEAQSINVSGTVPAVDTTSHDVGGVISQAQIDTLPIPNRQYLNLAILIPGTTQAATRTFYNSVQAGSGVYFFANGFYLDGVTNQQTEQGDPRQNVPEGAVAEFKTYTASFPAELGWAMGGFTTVVTKSGTNQIHGEAFEYFRNSFMNADNQFQKATQVAQHTGKAPYNRNQYGFDIGGPIFKNKTHYYGAYERTQQTTSYTMFVNGPAAAYYSSLLGTFKTPGHDNLLTLRLDHDLASNQQIFARYAQEWNLVSGNGCGPTTTIGCYDGQIPRRALVIGHTWEPKANIVNESRFQYAYISYQLGPWNTPLPKKPADLVDPNYTKNISRAYSFPSFGYGHTYSAVGVEGRWEVNDSLTIQKGAHSFKMGFDVSYVPYTDASASNVNGTYTFNTDQPFDPTSAASLAALTNVQQFAASAVPRLYFLPSTQEAFYFEDTWKLRPNLTLNGGIRYERQFGSPFLDTYTPDPSRPTIPFQGNPHERGDRNNFSPRLGLSWDPRGKQKDVLRAGYGVYYNFVQTEPSEGEKLNFVACNVSLVRNTATGYVPPYPDPYSGQSPTNFCSTSAPTVTILSPGLSNPYQHQFSLGYTRQLTDNLSISADGIYSRGLRDYKVYDLNYPLLNGVPNIGGKRPYSTFNQIQQHASTGASEYKALYLKLEKRMNSRYMYTLSYALSSALDNNPHSAPVNYVTPGNDWGPATIDQRHAVVASGSVMLPWGIVAGGIFSFRSSLPFSVTTTTQTDTTARPGIGVLPGSVLDANGAAQYVPGTTRSQGNRGINYAAINQYRSDLNAIRCPPATTVCASGYPLTTNLSSASVASTNYLNFDFRVSKTVFQREAKRLEVIGQAFNLFGRTNYNAVATSPILNTFGQATGAGNAQIGELAAKFTF